MQKYFVIRRPETLRKVAYWSQLKRSIGGMEPGPLTESHSDPEDAQPRAKKPRKSAFDFRKYVVLRQ